MADSEDVLEVPAQTEESPVARPKAPPIESRFLFVDVAAMRAKQLRRGALPRLDEEDFARDPHRVVPHKAERVAMEEVRHCLIQYEVPEFVRKDPRA